MPRPSSNTERQSASRDSGALRRLGESADAVTEALVIEEAALRGKDLYSRLQWLPSYGVEPYIDGDLASIALDVAGRRRRLLDAARLEVDSNFASTLPILVWEEGVYLTDGSLECTAPSYFNEEGRPHVQYWVPPLIAMAGGWRHPGFGMAVVPRRLLDDVSEAGIQDASSSFLVLDVGGPIGPLYGNWRSAPAWIEDVARLVHAPVGGHGGAH